MKGKNRITAFYLETLLMILVFISIIVVLSGVFGLARYQGVQARELNDAVCLAENAAEAVSASESVEDLAALLGGRVTESGVEADYDNHRNPAAADGDAFYHLTVNWEPSDTGKLIQSTISVYGEELLYSIDTAVFVQ